MKKTFHMEQVFTIIVYYIQSSLSPSSLGTLVQEPLLP